MDILPVTENQLEALAAVHVQSLKEAYADFVDPEYIDSLNVPDRTEKWTEWYDPEQRPIFMAWDDGNPVGFVNFGKLRTPPPGGSPIRPLYTSEIFAIYVLRDHWGKGIGKELMRAALTQLKEMKHTSMCLWVLEKNLRGVEFYKKLGGQRCGKQMIEMGRSKLKEVCYGWRDTSALLKSE